LKMFNCRFCSKPFRQNRSLQLHLHRCHQATDNNTHLCVNCGDIFPLHSVLVDHVRRVHSTIREIKCGTCDKSFKSSSNLKTHERIHSGEKPFRCTHCDFSSAQATPLKHHLRRHIGLKPYKCKYCDHPGFSYSSTLRQHLATTHTDL